jgi:high-affinity Fe2+/Pb2+ permease
MEEFLWEVFRWLGYLAGAVAAILFLLGLWYIAIKLASFAWSRGRKEAQNPHDWRSDGR